MSRHALLLASTLALVLPSTVSGILKELYATNAVCQPRYCVNPVFPAFNQMLELEKSGSFVKRTFANLTDSMPFCGQIVDYDFGIPAANTTDVTSLAYGQKTAGELDKKANKMYVFHLAGMGIDFWDHTDPLEESTHPLQACARSVAKLACYTYFPRALADLAEGATIAYTRPCKSSCTNFVSVCNVECCDDSVQCTFTTQVEKDNTLSLLTGYVDKEGPSLTCTESDKDAILREAKNAAARTGVAGFVAVLLAGLVSI